MTDIESGDIVDLESRMLLTPRRGERGFCCPYCDARLRYDEWTECSRCGAHLNLKVKVEATGVDSG